MVISEVASSPLAFTAYTVTVIFSPADTELLETAIDSEPAARAGVWPVIKITIPTHTAIISLTVLKFFIFTSIEFGMGVNNPVSL